jgi:hypothetical protein
MSLRSIAANGIRKAANRERTVAAPKSAIAPMGEKFGGCGKSLEAAAIATSEIRNEIRSFAFG